MNKYFHAFAEKMSRALGTPYAFALALLTVVVWALFGPAVGYNDTWQLTINTGTTIVTFLMVFLIQNTQNREARATQIKLDELLRAITEARTNLVNVDELTDEQLAALEQEFRRLGKSPADRPEDQPEQK
ncbi:MAG TPA: low affinity iron permease family protein [Polyangiaceae bacterium]|nr:low affinity iron permease family protein [Polyangiaceae bacterium]